MKLTTKMVRRSSERQGPRQFVDELAFSALDWAGKTVRLERNSVQDLSQRAASSQPSVAELYHENSKLFPALVGELAASQVDIDAVRSEVLRRRAEALATSPQAELTECSQDWLRSVSRAVPAESFYAIEVRVAEHACLATYEPVSDTFPLVRRLAAQDIAQIERALRVLPVPHELQWPLLFVVGQFARNDLLYGLRGYRRTCIEAGRVIEAALAVSPLGTARRLWLEFADRTLDLVLQADGIEEGVLGVISSEETAHVCQSGN